MKYLVHGAGFILISMGRCDVRYTQCVFSRICALSFVGATEQEIKDRYTKLALNWHPAQDKQAEKDNSVVTEVVVYD